MAVSDGQSRLYRLTQLGVADSVNCSIWHVRGQVRQQGKQQYGAGGTLSQRLMCVSG